MAVGPGPLAWGEIMSTIDVVTIRALILAVLEL